MYLEVFADNPYATNCWLLAAEGRDEALVVDPGFTADRVSALLAAAGKRPVAALATHGHSDHVGAAAALCGTELPLYIHKDDELALTDPVAWGAGFPSPIARPAVVRAVGDGDVIDEAGLVLEVIHTPGHTPGSCCFKLQAENGPLLLSGDTLFQHSIGRTDLPGGDHQQLLDSIARKLLPLGDEFGFICGHGPSSNIAHERATNPFLQGL